MHLSARDETIIDKVARMACKRKLEKVAKKKIIALATKLTRKARCKRSNLDLEDAVIVLEMIMKHPRCFMKELASMKINFEKYSHLQGFS